ncbi:MULTISPECIES: ribosomal protein S18-alanine N-acetyltransferase [Peptoniphilus]|uniref:ribosomal protein S18-alanine N-acetyltransferase n=1 Tax=Peptoniphilus TaxID=162289 RepID=UPI0001DCAB3F|nr:ribosomal protein S18-alanine N-acetyltransferase [Peptoniphilus sp. oral taxon 836]EFK39483.1 ribosomal-protein-alanine acetyltransferase [Peptoniphilus sp. oral taxon 836 str. F0141]
MQTKIRLAETGDVDDIYQIEKLSFENPWSKNSLINLIEKDKLSEILVYEIDNRVVSYISYMKIFDEIHIANVATHPDYRNKKIAGELFKYFVAYAEDNKLSITLEVKTTNEHALSLYRAFNFKIKGFRKNYYGIDKDALIMWREI